MAKRLLCALLGCALMTGGLQGTEPAGEPTIVERARKAATEGDLANAAALYEQAVLQNPSDTLLRIEQLRVKDRATGLSQDEALALQTLVRVEAARHNAARAQLRADLDRANAALENGDIASAVRIAREARRRVDATQADESLVSLMVAIDAIARLAEPAGAHADGLAPERLPPREASPVRHPAAHPGATVQEQALAVAPPLAIIDVQAVLDADEARYGLAGRQLRLNRQMAVGELMLVDAARTTIPGAVLQVPAEPLAPRPPAVLGDPAPGPDGQLTYTAVYDLSELMLDIPHFVNPYPMTLAEAQMIQQDRDALRLGSRIFNGSAAELAEGIPLLQYFGGYSDAYMVGVPAGNLALLEMALAQIAQNARQPQPATAQPAAPKPGP